MVYALWRRSGTPWHGPPGFSHHYAARENGNLMAEAESPSLTGACTCGAIRYRLLSRPLIVHCCHCRWCQRESGSAFALNAMIEAERVELQSGQPQSITIPSASGKGQKVSRCTNCQIAVWSIYAGAGDAFHFVRVGTLHHPDLLPPDMHIFTESKQPWVSLSPEIPAFETFYQRSRYWPAESQERRQDVLAKLGAK